MPLLQELGTDHGGYGLVMDQTFQHLIKNVDVSSGSMIYGLKTRACGRV
jgi:hypothetical protein